MSNEIKKYIGSRSCAVLGLGVSNLPLVRMLCRENSELTVYDKNTVSELGEAARELERSGVRFARVGRNFEGIGEDVVFRSPGIRPDVVGITDAVARGAELISEMELFLKLTPARTYAITGSDGKTTSTTLTGKFLSEACDRVGARAYVGGNIGTPLLDKSEEMTEKDASVLELSSFQLMTLADAPECVAITNISPNHLDWHTGMDEYIAAKKRIIGQRTHRLVTNAECADTLQIARECASRSEIEILLFSSKKHSYGEIYGKLAPSGRAYAVYEKDGYICVADRNAEQRVLAISDIRIPGRHNIENYMTAIALTWGDVPTEIYSDVARQFFGVEHRLELVRTLGRVDYYNSSIDSSPTRTAAALSALAGRSIVLICGGYDKKIPYAPLAEAICRHGGVRAVVLTGATGEKIGEEIRKYVTENGSGSDIVLEYRKDFGDAVLLAHGYAAPGDCVVLSPASASFDAFKNFAERGNVFKKLVGELE